MGAKKGPVIKLTKNEKRWIWLWEKLFEYDLALENSRCPFEVQKCVLYRRTVLERLLRDGHVLGTDMELEMRVQLGEGFDFHALASACIVIEDYNTTGGQNLSGASK